MKKSFILSALRTPVGKYGGSLSSVRPDDLAAIVIREICRRNSWLNPEEIEDVIFGDANQAGEDNRNVARMAVLLAGLPVSVAGVTVNRLCASGLQAIMDASRAIQCGDGSIFIAGGVESMTRAPFVMSKSENPFQRTTELFDTTIGWRFINKKLSEKHHPFSMGETAGNVAQKWEISRKEQDEFAYQSQLKYKNALASGKFNDEIVPVEYKNSKGELSKFETDEHPRFSPIEKLSQLKPAFSTSNTITAGNSSGINDGAAALLLADEETVKKHSLNPFAIVRSIAVTGVDPSIMGIGPIPAVRKALKRANLSIEDIGLVELNEAFASQSIACIRELGLNPDRVNVNGGSIAIGHPLGASGARISVTLLHELRRRPEVKFGLATMCVGVGQGAAVIFEKVG